MNSAAQVLDSLTIYRNPSLSVHVLLVARIECSLGRGCFGKNRGDDCGWTHSGLALCSLQGCSFSHVQHVSFNPSMPHPLHTMSNDNDSTLTSVRHDRPSLCTICYFPSWTTEDRLHNDSEVEIKSFANVNRSAEDGCDGCKILAQAWLFAKIDDADREDSTLYFNKLNGSKYVHIFHDDIVHIGIFTLPGTFSYAICHCFYAFRRWTTQASPLFSTSELRVYYRHPRILNTNWLEYERGYQHAKMFTRYFPVLRHLSPRGYWALL